MCRAKIEVSLLSGDNLLLSITYVMIVYRDFIPASIRLVLHNIGNVGLDKRQVFVFIRFDIYCKNSEHQNNWFCYYQKRSERNHHHGNWNIVEHVVCQVRFIRRLQHLVIIWSACQIYKPIHSLVTDHSIDSLNFQLYLLNSKFTHSVQYRFNLRLSI